MSVMDKIKSMLKGHEDVADKGIDKAGDEVDQRTDSKYADQVDTAQEKARKQLGEQGEGEQSES